MKHLLVICLTLSLALAGCGGSETTTTDSRPESSNLEEIVDDSWVPEGFEVLPSNTNVAIRFPGQDCDDYNCIDIEFVTKSGCSYFYAAVNALTKQGGSVIGYDNASLPSIRPLQVAKLRFEDTSNSSGYMEIAEVICN